MTATWAGSPFLTRRLVAAWTHISSMGPDEPGKSEIAADLLRDAAVFCDDRILAASMGVAQGGGLGSDIIEAELGDVLGHSHPASASEHQITVFSGVGPDSQDVVAAL